jgi:hypothetical protein
MPRPSAVPSSRLAGAVATRSAGQRALDAVGDSLAAHFATGAPQSLYERRCRLDDARMRRADRFEQDIKPLFREARPRLDALRFDLWSLEDVSTHADAILHRLDAGTMPCDGAWPSERVAVFRRWIEAGKAA